MIEEFLPYLEHIRMCSFGHLSVGDIFVAGWDLHYFMGFVG